MLEAAHLVIEAVKANDTAAARAVGVDLDDVSALRFVRIADIRARGNATAVDLDNVRATGGIDISGVDVDSGAAPERPSRARRSPRRRASTSTTSTSAATSRSRSSRARVIRARDISTTSRICLAFYRRRFVTREDELAIISSHVDRAAPGYVLVEAPGGFGKSALLAQLVDRVGDATRPGPRPAMACFFIRADGARNTAVAFLQAINAQLLDALGADGGTPPGVTELRAQLSELWAAASERATIERPLLLIVDGLDEMAAEAIAIADLLPTALGAHVHVVVSSRTKPDPRDAVPPEHPLQRAHVLELRSRSASRRSGASSSATTSIRRERARSASSP